MSAEKIVGYVITSNSYRPYNCLNANKIWTQMNNLSEAFVHPGGIEALKAIQEEAKNNRWATTPKRAYPVIEGGNINLYDYKLFITSEMMGFPFRADEYTGEELSRLIR